MSASDAAITWAFSHFLRVRAIHVPGVRNSAAIGRHHPLAALRLHPEMVEMIWARYGNTIVDLNSGHNSLPTLVSLMDSSQNGAKAAVGA